MIEEKSWKEFKDSGLLWFVNRTLHLFGWAIVIAYNEASEVVEVYPARVTCRGFTEDVETKGFIAVSDYLKNNINELSRESRE